MTGVNSINLTSDLTISSTHTNAGTYTDSWVFSAANYNTASGTVIDTITPAALTISASNETMVQGNPVPTLAVSYKGFVDGQTAANLTVKSTASTTATSKSLPGLYVIKIAGAVDPNYVVNYVPAILTVTPPVVIGGSFAQFTNVTTQGSLIGGSVSVNGTTINFNVNPKTSVIYYPFFQCT